MQQANQQNKSFLSQRIEAEKRKSRELLKRVQEIKSLRHKRIIEEEQNAALSLAETFASNISKGKEKLEMGRKLQLEERQMRNMETLVSAVSHSHVRTITLQSQATMGSINQVGGKTV